VPRKGTTSKTSSKRSNERRRVKTPSRAYGHIREGLEDAIAHARGDITLPAKNYTITGPVDPVDVKAIREQSGLSQSEFAGRFGFSLRTLQDWEQGRAIPDSAVRAYLTVIRHDPEAVRNALVKTS
jgi:putative transcriptional regulator